VERESQTDAPEVHAARSLPDRESIRRQEMARALGGVLRGRRYILPALAGALLALVLINPITTRVTGWLCFALPASALVLADRWRTRRKHFVVGHVPLDMTAAVVMQSMLVSLTGMIDSPLLPVLFAMALLSGLAMATRRQHAMYVGLVSLVIWLLLALQLDGRWPLFAALLAPPPTETSRLLWRAGAIQGLVIVAGLAGHGVYTVMMRIVDSAIDARQGLLVSLASRNEELVSLSGALAHELKNPLASVQGLVTLLERSDDNRTKRFEVVNREIERMKLTLDELLHFARPVDQATTEAPLVPARLFERLASERGASAEARGVKLSALMPSGEHPLAADTKKLLRALANLVDNAIEASPSGAEIEWIALVAGDHLELGVADRGPGIPDVAGRLGFTTKPEGSGLGLVVSRTIAEQHGGALIARAREGGGTIMVLSLPLKRRAA